MHLHWVKCIRTENGSIIVKPTADPKNPVQREIKAYEERVANSALLGFPLNPLSVVKSPEDAIEHKYCSDNCRLYV